MNMEMGEKAYDHDAEKRLEIQLRAMDACLDEYSKEDLQKIKEMFLERPKEYNSSDSVEYNWDNVDDASSDDEPKTIGQKVLRR